MIVAVSTKITEFMVDNEIYIRDKMIKIIILYWKRVKLYLTDNNIINNDDENDKNINGH